MADSDGRAPAAGNLSLDYGAGGRTISILPDDPGVCEGISAEIVAGPFKVNTKGPSDISWSDSDSGL